MAKDEEKVSPPSLGNALMVQPAFEYIRREGGRGMFVVC